MHKKWGSTVSRTPENHVNPIGPGSYTFEYEFRLAAAGEKEAGQRCLKHQSHASGRLRIAGKRTAFRLPGIKSDLQGMEIESPGWSGFEAL